MVVINGSMGFMIVLNWLVIIVTNWQWLMNWFELVDIDISNIQQLLISNGSYWSVVSWTMTNNVVGNIPTTWNQTTNKRLTSCLVVDKVAAGQNPGTVNFHHSRGCYVFKVWGLYLRGLQGAWLAKPARVGSWSKICQKELEMLKPYSIVGILGRPASSRSLCGAVVF